MSDHKDLVGILDFEGIKVCKEIKYLGHKISLSRKQLIHDAKEEATKYLLLIKGKIQTQHESLKRIIFGAFFKSIIIYFLTPLYAAGAIDRNDILMHEAGLKRRNLLLPNDISSKVINNVNDFFVNSTDTIIHKLALK